MRCGVCDRRRSTRRPAVTARRAAGIGALAKSAPHVYPATTTTRLRSTWHSKHTAQAPRLTRASTIGPVSLSKRRNPNMHAINLSPIVGWGRRREQIQMDTQERDDGLLINAQKDCRTCDARVAYTAQSRSCLARVMNELHVLLLRLRSCSRLVCHVGSERAGIDAGGTLHSGCPKWAHDRTRVPDDAVVTPRATHGGIAESCVENGTTIWARVSHLRAGAPGAGHDPHVLLVGHRVRRVNFPPLNSILRRAPHELHRAARSLARSRRLPATRRDRASTPR